MSAFEVQREKFAEWPSGIVIPSGLFMAGPRVRMLSHDRVNTDTRPDPKVRAP